MKRFVNSGSPRRSRRQGWGVSGAVWIGLCWCGLAGHAWAQHSPVANRIYVNGRVLTCDESFTVAECFAIGQGSVLGVGDRASLQRFVGEKTEWIDLEGKCVTPGLCDSHLHFVGLGVALQQLDLRTARTWDEIIDQVAARAGELTPGTWILGRGWHQSKWDRPAEPNVEGYPVHNELSRRVPDHPVLLTHTSGHASFANEMAMRLSGVTDATEPPDGGEILRDDDGQPIGVFRENAQRLVTRNAGPATSSEPDDSPASVERAVSLAGQECLKYGITSVHDAGISFGVAKSLRQLDDRGKLPVRVYSMIREPIERLRFFMPSTRTEPNDSKSTSETPLTNRDPSGRLDIRSVKVSLDGALGPHGAWLLQPYDDLPSSVGLNLVTLDELREIADFCREFQLQLCVHAIGDRANRETLNVFEDVWADAGKETDHRWRIEHAQHIDREDLPRFAELGVIPAMQANHCTSDALYVVERLGIRRASDGAYMWRDLIDSGCVIPNGTDAPVEPIDPRVNLHASVTRQLPDGETFFATQCMTRQEALWSLTRWPAMASFAENRIGSLERGKLADFVIWDRDLSECSDDELLSAQVFQTWLGGKQVFVRSTTAE